MKGDRLVIRELNKNLGLLLVTINQYFLHARILKTGALKNWANTSSNNPSAKWNPQTIDRAYFVLGGLPNLQELGKLLIGESTEEIIACDLKKEYEKHDALVAAIALAEEQQDYVSRDLLEKQKDINEEHIDWLETQQELIGKVGLPNYLQTAAQED